MKKKKTSKPEESADQVGARKAKLRMERATEHYHETRNLLIAKLKDTPSPAEKKNVIGQLDRCERDFAHIRNAYQSGRIEADCIREDRRRRAKPRPKPKSGSKTRTSRAKAPKKNKAKDPQQGGWVNIYADDPRPTRAEREAARDLHDVLRSSQRHPFKTNDRRDDMRYQTHGVRNHRAKRTF